MDWKWSPIWNCGDFLVSRATPAEGEELLAVTYGEPVPDRPDWVRTYTVAYNRRGTILATWGDGSQSTLTPDTWGPNLGEEDQHLIPAGTVRYLPTTGDVEFYCVTPQNGGLLEHTPYTSSTTLLDTADTYVLVWRGQVAIEGNALGELGMVHIKDDRPVEVLAGPDAFYVHIRRR